jgi:hypothetical protein
MSSPISKPTLLSVSAGFLGGALAGVLLSPQLLMAQFEPPPSVRPHKRPAATEVDAQRLVLVDPTGLVTAEMKMEDGEPEIILYDKSGRIAWRATTHQSGFQPLSANSKPFSP